MMRKTYSNKTMSTSKRWKKYIGLTGILFLFPLTWLLVFGLGAKHKFNTLKYFEPTSEGPKDYSDYSIPSFVFQDENGNAFSSDSLNGKVWLACFFSLKDEHAKDITERLLSINFKYRNEPDIMIVCFSTDCSHDTPTMLKAYVDQNERYNEFNGKWKFLTGDQVSMQSFIRIGFFAEDLSQEARFRLVDNVGHVRGMYGNTEFHLKAALEDISLLKKEIDLKAYNERKAKENS
jgi:cytochrome oxidase Cu insertion factor (SCO1/SenC/PrrC family)